MKISGESFATAFFAASRTFAISTRRADKILRRRNESQATTPRV